MPGDRTGPNRVALGIVLQWNRLILAGGLTVVVFLAVTTGLSILEPPFTQRAARSDPIETLFSAMITTVVTVTTLVVTIGQLVISQENGPLGDQRERLRNAMAVREEVRELTGAPSPVDPAVLLDAVLQTAQERARTLTPVDRTGEDALAIKEQRDETAGPMHGQTGKRCREAPLDAALQRLGAGVVTETEAVLARLEDAEFGSFAVIGAALEFEYDTPIARVESMQRTYDDRLSPEESATLAELKHSLVLFAAVREHVKTLYFQWALIDLSRLILLAAIPALVVAAIAIGVVTPETAPGSTLGVEHLTLLVSGAFAVTFLPFSIFTAYVLRVLTVTKRTLAIDPLVLREGEA